AVATTAAAPPRRLVKHGILGWLVTTNHKQIGILYICTTLVFFLIAGFLADVIRLQLAGPQQNFVSPHTYNEVFTLHGTAMIFLFIAPFGFGIANFLIPLQRGRHGLSAPQRLRILAVPFGRSHGVLRRLRRRRRRVGRLVRLHAALRHPRLVGHRSGPVVHRADAHEHLGHPDRDQLPGHAHRVPRAGDDDVAASRLQVGDDRDVAAHPHGVPAAHGGVRDGPDGPARERAFLRSDARRRPGALPAHVL